MTDATQQITLPSFDLEVVGGTRLTNADLQGHKTVLYFYPKDDTPGCTLEGREFSALSDKFEAASVPIYGVSPDPARSHERFREKCEISIPLAVDTDHSLASAIGAWGEKTFAGRSYMGILRTTLLIGSDGSVERVWRDVKPEGHAAEVLAAL